MTPAQSPDKGAIRVNIVDGTRQPFPAGKDILLRVLDGSRRQRVTQWVDNPGVLVTDLPFADNPDDMHTVFAHSKGYNDGAVYPVQIKKGQTVNANLMMTPSNGQFHFRKWADLQGIAPGLLQLVTNGAANAAARYGDTMEKQQLQLGALLTIGSAVGDIALDDGTSPLTYYWEVMWDRLAPDRIWAWAEVGLADRIARMAQLGAFAPEADSAHWHPASGGIGAATRSWKQTRFDVCNVQMTFHEGDRSERTAPNGRKVQCVVVEPDIDYYKDLVAHGLLEVLPNSATGGKTDPRVVYAMRWMATLQEGLPAFNPPCTIE